MSRKVVLIHKREHLNDETFVVRRVRQPRGAIDRQHCGQVTVIIVGTPGAENSDF